MFSLNIEINRNQSQFVTSSVLRSQFASSNQIVFVFDEYINRSQIATSSSLKAKNVIVNSMSQLSTLKKLCVAHSLNNWI